MPNVFRTVTVCAVCLISLAQPSPLTAQSTDQPGEGNASIYNLDRNAGTGGVAIDGPIDKAVASHAVQLIKSVRPDVNDLMIYLNSPGGDPAAAMELGEEVRKQWALTVVDEHGECLGACVLVLAAGVRRTPMPDRVGIYNPSLEPKELAGLSRGSQKNAGLAKRVQTYLARMGMPARLYSEMVQRPPDKMLLLDAGRLKALGLEGVYPAYEEWLRTNANQQPAQPN